MGAIVYLVVLVLVFVPAISSGGVSTHHERCGPARGMVGVVMGWLAWYSAVEPLPEERIEKMAQQLKRYAKLRADCASNP